ASRAVRVGTADVSNLDPGGHPRGGAYDSSWNGRSHGGRRGVDLARGRGVADRVGRPGLTGIDAYQGQERLFGARASETTAHRVLKSIDEQLLAGIRAAPAAAR